MRTSAVITIGEAATTGNVEEVLPMSENGGTPVSAIPVPPKTFLEIDDYDVAAGGAIGTFRLEQTNDGVNFFTIGSLLVSGTGLGVSMMASPSTPWLIDGNAGPAVAVRVGISTLGGPIPVTCNLFAVRIS